MTQQTTAFEVSTRAMYVSGGRRMIVTSIKIPMGGTLRLARNRLPKVDLLPDLKIFPSRKSHFVVSRPTRTTKPGRPS